MAPSDETHTFLKRPDQLDPAVLSVESPTGVADPRGMKPCPIHRASFARWVGWQECQSEQFLISVWCGFLGPFCHKDREPASGCFVEEQRLDLSRLLS